MAATKPFASYDYDDMVVAYSAFLKSQETFKDYNFEGSGMKELIRLLAFDTQQRAFQNNFVSNELNLGTSSIRENAVSLASNLGYVSTGKTAAKMNVTIKVTPKDLPETNTLTLKKDVKFFSNINGKVIFFSPDKEYTSTYLNSTFVFEDVTLVQGVWTFSAFTASGNNVVESFTLPNKGVDINFTTVQVRDNIDSTQYTVHKRFESAYDLGKDSAIFFTRENRKGFFEIEFGEGKFAKKLSYGNLVLVEYLVTDGADGNGIVVVTPASGVDNYFDVQVSTLQNSYLGADEEPIETIRRATPLSNASQGSATTVKDYEGIVRSLFSGLQDVVAWGGEDNVPTRTGTVFISVVYPNQNGLTLIQKNDIKTALKKYNVGTVLVDVVDANYTYLNVSTLVRFNPNQTLLLGENIQQKTKDALIVYSRNELEKFKGYFDKSKLIEYINNIDASIKGNVTSVSFEKRFVPALNFSGTYSFRFQTGIKPGSVLLQGFWVDSPEIFGTVTFFIKDDNFGKLILWKKDISSGTEFSMGQIGNVNYDSGIVDLVGFSPNTIADYVTVETQTAQTDESSDTLGQEVFKINNTVVTSVKVYD